MQTVDSEILTALKKAPLFNELSESELVAIAERTQRSQYPKGAFIFYEGDACTELFIIQAGTVRLAKLSPGGREQLIAVERAGNSIEELPVFDGGKYSTTATTLEPCTLLRLDARQFLQVCSQHPQVAMKLIKVLGHRLRHLDALVEELSFSTVRGRLIMHLLRLADKAGRGLAGNVEFELPENNEELAARLGTVRELISRNLGRLYSDGLIKMHRRTLSIPDINRLRAESRG